MAEDRLSVFPLEVPPLRERREDNPPLETHFLERGCKRFNRTGLQLPQSQIRQSQNHDWPGNVRELQNLIERALITSLGIVPGRSSRKRPISSVRVRNDFDHFSPWAGRRFTQIDLPMDWRAQKTALQI